MGAELQLSGTPSARAAHLLNGRSDGHAPRWAGTEEGDYLVAKVHRVEVREDRWEKTVTALNMLVEEGCDAGVALPEDVHRIVYCSSTELRRMIELLDPKPGDTLAIAFLGKKSAGPTARRLYRYSIESSARPAETGSPRHAASADEGF